MNPSETPAAVAQGAVAADDTQQFETLLTELEAIVERLERGNIPLSESVSAFERGMGLVRRAEAVLSQAEERVEQLLADAAGNVRRVPFDAGPDADG